MKVIEEAALEDIISEAIQDSMDIDWNSTMGAKAVVAALLEHGMVVIYP